jgi:DnaJ-class molecular chaperone
MTQFDRIMQHFDATGLTTPKRLYNGPKFMYDDTEWLEILELTDPLPTMEVLTQAHKRLMRAYHPDIRPNDGSVDKINRAYEIGLKYIQKVQASHGSVENAKTNLENEYDYEPSENNNENNFESNDDDDWGDEALA